MVVVYKRYPAGVAFERFEDQALELIDSEGLPPDLAVAGLVLAIAGRVREHLTRRAGELGLTAQEMDVLLAVDDAPYSMSELADRVRVDPANLTRIVRRLERRGLLARHHHEHDKRLKALTLTEDGERLHDAFRARMTVDLPAVAGLTDRQRAQLLDLLGRVARAN
jgi:DNA-binding MarR family transcriptional regulator